MRLSLCICTMNRPGDLRRCLESVRWAATPPEEILVSDDSGDGQESRAVAGGFPGVRYQCGPRRGLGANRNACLRRATGDFVLFLDDDTRVPPDFFAAARARLAGLPSRTILTGGEINHASGEAHRVTPHNADFWGLQRVPVTGEYRAIVINATFFPRGLFREIAFDEQLRYGCDEIDIARHAVARGYRIVFADSLAVHHYPSPVNRDLYHGVAQAARLYATAKAYWRYERSLPKTLFFVCLAPWQLAGSAARRHGPGGVAVAWRATGQAVRCWRAARRGVCG